jgi:hypothetical protein
MELKGQDHHRSCPTQFNDVWSSLTTLLQLFSVNHRRAQYLRETAVDYHIVGESDGDRQGIEAGNVVFVDELSQ